MFKCLPWLLQVGTLVVKNLKNNQFQFPSKELMLAVAGDPVDKKKL